MKTLNEELYRIKGLMKINDSVERLVEQDKPTDQQNIILSTTSKEDMPNATNVKNGLIDPQDTTKFPLENTVFTCTVPELLSKGLSAFKPIRTTKQPLDVIKIGNAGGDYPQGGKAAIEFMSSSTDAIEASHNGLLVLQRVYDIYTSKQGLIQQKPVKIIVKIGQNSRISSFLNLADMFYLINNGPAGWEGQMVASLIPNGQFADNPYKKEYDGKTAEQRISFLNEQLANGFLFAGTIKRFGINVQSKPQVDYATWVNTYFGKITNLEDFKNPQLNADFAKLYDVCKNTFYSNIKTYFDDITKTTGIVVPNAEAILQSIMDKKVASAIVKAQPIMNNASGLGSPVKGGNNASTKSYNLGQGTGTSSKT